MLIDLKTINIDSNESLISACSYLHDASFDLSSLSHDKEQRSCSMIFEREFSEDPSLRQGKPLFFFFEKIFYPLVETVLTLNGVKCIEITDRARMGRYFFDGCSIQDNNLSLKFRNRTGNYGDGVQIDIILNEVPTGSLVDQKILDKDSHIHTFQLRKFFR